MPNLSPHLTLQRCPHCNVDTPSLMQLWGGETRDQAGASLRRWIVYGCQRCGGLVTACAQNFGGPVTEHFPTSSELPENIPTRAAEYLQQAMASLHAPAGAIMLAASCVDAMLKEKGYKVGSLNARIDEAAKANLITVDMAKWAHAVRLDANDQRHADESAPLPDANAARRCIDFASTLAEILFTLPARVAMGLSTPP